MATTLPRLSQSLKSAPTYAYKTGALTVGKNSFVLTGVPQGFVPIADNFQIFVRTTSNAATPAAGYATLDEASLIIDPTDSTQVLVDVYASSSIKQALIFLG